MGDEVKIDKDIFQTRLGRLVSSWKADKLKAGEGGFNGANSIIILLGKSDDSSYQKNNSMHVGHDSCGRMRQRGSNDTSSGSSATNFQQR